MMKGARGLARWMLQVVRSTFLRWHRRSLRYPVATLVIFFLFAGLSLLPLGKLRMLLSIDDLVDPDFQTYTQLKSLNENFLDKDEIFVVVRKKDSAPWQKHELCALTAWIQRTADSRGDIRAIVSALGIQWPTQEGTDFKVIPLIHPDCVSDQPEVEKIRSGFSKLSESPWRGSLVSDKADDIGILIYPEARTDSDFFGTFNHKVVDELRQSLEKEVLESNPTLTASWVGDGIFQYHLRKGYEFMPALNLLMSLFALIFFRATTGTFLSGFLFLCSITWVSLPVYAGMALAGHPIDVLSSSLSLMIFVASLEDYVFITYMMRFTTWRKAFRKMLVPGLLTSVTTAIGFSSLAFADIAIIRRFGLWAAAGAMAEALVIFIILPALFVKFPRLSRLVVPEKIWKMPSIPSVARMRRPRFISRLGQIRFLKYAGFIVFPLALVATQKLYVSDSPENLLAESHPARQALNVIETTRGWRAQVSLVFADHDNEKFNRAVLQQASHWPLVDQIEDPYSIRDFMSSHLDSSLKGMMTTVLERNTLGHRLGPSGLESRAILYVKNLDIVDINKLREKTAELCPKNECWLAGTLVSYGELGSRVLSTLYSSLGGSLVQVVFILLVLCLVFDPRAFFPLMISSMWGPAALLACFYVFDIPVFYITSMIASIMVGVAGDNAIHFLFFSTERSRLDEGISHLAPAAYQVGIGMMLASSVFFFGYFAPMRTLGAVMILGVALSLIGEVGVLSVLVNDKKK